MPTLVENDITVKPTYVEKPDSRFATTHLDYKYRDYSVPGETMMDKVTGEIFHKRRIDEKVVSFYQNKKYMDQVMLELRVLLTDNANFVYPRDNYNALYLIEDFDNVSALGETFVDIITDDIVYDTSNPLKFKLSTQTTGYFIRPVIRDSDKALLEYLTNIYNTHVKDYTGSVETILEESEKFDDPLWEDSNVILDYDVAINEGEASSFTINQKVFVRANENMCVYLPMDDIRTRIGSGNIDRIDITINSLEFHKLHFILDNIDYFDDKAVIMANYRKLIPVDNSLKCYYTTVFSFVDTASDIIPLDFSFITCLLDVPYVRRYMNKMSKIKEASDILFSSERPDPGDWAPNSIWMEYTRKVETGGVEIIQPSETDMDGFARQIAKVNVINDEEEADD